MRRRGQAGSALLTALLVLFLVSVSLALLAASLHLRMRLARQEAETVNLVTLADGALAETLAHLYVDPAFQGVPEHPLGRGRVKSRVTGQGMGLYTVVATAAYADKERSVQAEVVRTVTTKRDAFGQPRPVIRVRVTSWRRLAGGRGGGGVE